jgi:hypothetical protein
MNTFINQSNNQSNNQFSDKPYNIDFKNPIFEKNVIDPTNGKIVKSIYAHNWTKLARDHWFMVWQFYRDRKRTSIQQIYDKYKDTQIEIIYKGDPIKYLVGTKKSKPEAQIRNKDKKELVAKVKKEEQLKLKELVESKQIPCAIIKTINICETKEQQLDNSENEQQLDNSENEQQLDNSENEQQLDNSENEQQLDNSGKKQSYRLEINKNNIEQELYQLEINDNNIKQESEKKQKKKREVQPPLPKKQEVVTEELRVLYEERARIQVQAKYFKDELKKCTKKLHEINKQVHRIKNPEYNKPKAPQFPKRIKNKEKYDKNKERNKLLKQQKNNKENIVSV